MSSTIDERTVQALRDIVGFAAELDEDVVAHQYGFIDYRIVWRALVDDLPRDVANIQVLLGSAS